MADDTRLIPVGSDIERLRRIENQIRGFLDSDDASPSALRDAEDDAELLRSLADSYEDGITKVEALGAGAAVSAVLDSAPHHPPALLSVRDKLRAAFPIPPPEEQK